MGLRVGGLFGTKTVGGAKSGRGRFEDRGGGGS